MHPQTDCRESNRLRALLATAEAEVKALRGRGAQLLAEVAEIGALVPAQPELRALVPPTSKLRVPAFPIAEKGPGEAEVEGPEGALRHARAVVIATRELVGEEIIPAFSKLHECTAALAMAESGFGIASAELEQRAAGSRLLSETLLRVTDSVRARATAAPQNF